MAATTNQQFLELMSKMSKTSVGSVKALKHPMKVVIGAGRPLVNAILAGFATNTQLSHELLSQLLKTHKSFGWKYGLPPSNSYHGILGYSTSVLARLAAAEHGFHLPGANAATSRYEIGYRGETSVFAPVTINPNPVLNWTNTDHPCHAPWLLAEKMLRLQGIVLPVHNRSCGRYEGISMLADDEEVETAEVETESLDI